MSELRYIRYQENGEWKYASVKTIGDLTTLKTRSKDDIVSAINSMFENGGIIKDILDDLEGIEGDNADILEQIDGIHEIIEINKETVENMERMSEELKEKQQAMEEMQSAMEARQQEILDSLEEKINKEEYDLEYKEIVDELKKKVSSYDFENLTGEFTKVEKQVNDLEEEVSTKLSKVDFDDSVGVNKWTFDSYEIEGTNFSATNPSFEFIKGISPVYSEEIQDQVDLSYLREANRINHLFTNVNLEISKSVGFEVKFKDGIAIYMNGALIYRNNSPVEITANVSLSLREGWNTVEILHGFNNPNPKLQMTPLLSSQVEKMTTVIGVGGKNETRLVHNETELKQTQKSISLKADQTVVSQIGNNVANNTAELEVHAEAIKQTVKETEFNEYTKKLTDAVADIEINAEAIKNRVNRTEYDALNEIVVKQGTKIDQTAEDIELKVDKSELNELDKTVKNNTTKIGLNETQISLKAEKSELDKTNQALSNAVAEINIHSGKIEQTVTREEFNNLEIGGRNLLTNSHNVDWWNAYGSVGTEVAVEKVDMKEEWGFSEAYRMTSTVVANPSSSIRILATTSGRFSMVNDEVYTYSIYIKNLAETRVRFNINGLRDGYSAETIQPNESKRFVFYGVRRPDYDWFQPRLEVFDENDIVDVIIGREQVEKGNKATDWRQAPEDIDDRMSKYETKIEQNEKSIALKADQTTVEKKLDTTTYTNKIGQIETSINGVTTRVGKTETAVDGLTGEMTSAKKSIAELDVKADGIISSVTKLTDSVGNLVNNPELTGNHTGWNTGSVTSTMQDFEGVSTRVLRNTSTTDATTYSDWFEVDPSKAYEVSIWVKKSANRGRFYFGVHGSSNGSSNNVAFGRVSRSSGVSTTDSTNSYFFSTNRAPTVWEKITGYIMPTGTTPIDLKGLGTTNIGHNFIMKSNLKQIRLRWLNYENGGTTTYTYVAMPKVVEVSSDTLTYASSTVSQLSTEISSKVSTVDYTGAKMASLISQSSSSIKMIADNISLTGVVTISGGTTTIANAKITNAMIDSVNANKISATNLSAISADLGNVTAGNIKGVTIEGGSIKSNTTIDVTTNLSVGNNIYIGKQGAFDLKTISFHDKTRIRADDVSMLFNSGKFSFSSAGGLDINTGSSTYTFGNNIVELDGNVMTKSTYASGRTNGGLQLPDNNVISTGAVSGLETLTLYGSRQGGRDPFRVRSHNGSFGSYRTDFSLNDLGRIYTPPTFDNTTTNSANLRVGTTAGMITRNTSLRKYKLDIETAENPYNILDLEARTWFDKGDIERYAEALRLKAEGKDYDLSNIEYIKRIGGLIAEEVVDAGLELYAEYDETGKLSGVAYDRIWTLLIPIVRDLVYEMNILSMENQHFKKELIEIRKEINELKQQ